MALDPALLTDTQLLACLREAGRRYGGRQVLRDGLCEVCGVPMLGVTTRRKTCSDRCRWRKAKRAQARRRRAERLLQDPLVALEARLRRMGWLPNITEDEDEEGCR